MGKKKVQKTKAEELQDQIFVKQKEYNALAKKDPQFNPNSPVYTKIQGEIEELYVQQKKELSRQEQLFKGPLTYRGITANCGNDAIGKQASAQIADTISKEEPDFIILNCQEVNFKKTKKQLEEALPPGYEVTLVSQMATHTKLSTQFNSSTGIATYVIHKKGVTVEVEETTEARINPNRLGGGSAYNKGGLITNLNISKGEQHISVQAVSGHLDSNSASKRSRDWHKLHQEMAKTNERVGDRNNMSHSSWEGLVRSCPDLIISGYDANTRNLRAQNNQPVNPWDNPNKSSDLNALYRAPLGGRNYSDPSTYKSNVPNITTDDAAKKRLGYAKGGMLDFVSISDGSPSNNAVLTNVQKVQPESGTARDHDVVISPQASYSQRSEFYRVRDHIASRLERAAPELAQQIRGLTESAESKEHLLNVHDALLAPNGLLNQMIDLHAKKLAAEQPEGVNETQAQQLKTRWFSSEPWFKGLNLQNLEQGVQQIRRNMSSEHAIINGLNQFEKNPQKMEATFLQLQKIVSRVEPQHAKEIMNLQCNTQNWLALHLKHEQLLQIATNAMKSQSPTADKNWVETRNGGHPPLPPSQRPAAPLPADALPLPARHTPGTRVQGVDNGPPPKPERNHKGSHYEVLPMKTPQEIAEQHTQPGQAITRGFKSDLKANRPETETPAADVREGYQPLKPG